jgi:hypothetical protein
VILLFPLVATLLVILLHGATCRLPLPFGSVTRFLIVGSLCGLATIMVTVAQYGLTANVIGAALVFAFAAELYLFLFTMALTSVSANALVLLRTRQVCRGDINDLYSDGGMAALRIERLLATRLAQEHNGSISLTRRGQAVAQVFAWLRTVFGHKPID